MDGLLVAVKSGKVEDMEGSDIITFNAAVDQVNIYNFSTRELETLNNFCPSRFS